MKTWNGEIRVARMALLRAKAKMVVTALPHNAAIAILTPSQAMRLANQLRRWAMQYTTLRDCALPPKLEK